MCLRDVLEEFILELEMQNYSPRRVKSYRNNNMLMFTFIENEFAITKLESIQTVHIKAYIKLLQKNKRKVYWSNGIIKSFRAFFKYALNEEYIDNNPVHKVAWLRERKSLINSFTDEEVERMMKVYVGSDYLVIRNKLIIAFLFDTGIRCLEF